MRNREEKKKCKGQESTIGKIIYGFLLFLPLLAIGVTCGYVMFNKNAYQSYAGETINESEYENITVSQMEVGKDYYLITPTSQTYTTKTGNTQFVVSNVTINNTSKNVNELRFYVIANSTTLTIQGVGDEGFIYQNTQSNTLKFTFGGVSNNTYASDIDTILYNKVYVTSSYLSEVFYYSIDKIQQSPLFNWAENSIIYTTTSTTCNALSITTPFIPLLMSYWLIISVIYFLYDIALMLVWIVHHKIHELQESI